MNRTRKMLACLVLAAAALFAACGPTPAPGPSEVCTRTKVEVRIVDGVVVETRPITRDPLEAGWSYQVTESCVAA